MGLDEDTHLPDWIPKLAGGLLASFLGLAAALAMFTPAWPLSDSIATPLSDRPTLLVIESQSCGWCRRFRANVAPAYEQSRFDRLAPLKYLDVGTQRRSGYRLKSYATAVPTFVLVDAGGQEVARLRGLNGGPAQFLPAVEGMLAKLPNRSEGG